MAKNELRSRNRARLRLGMVIVGITATAMSVLADVIGLSKTGIGNVQILVALVGIIIAAVGLLGRRLIAIYKASAFILLNTVILIVFLEIGIRALEGVYWWLHPPQPTIYFKAATLPYYTQQDWSAQYWNEWYYQYNIDGVLRYFPYAVWRDKPYEGETINVNQDGIRVTPGADCEPDSYRVFAFGGSTMWGEGAPDGMTMPAYLQSDLEVLTDRPVCVVNFGQLAYISTQEIITLLSELQRGNIPDVVIFYDGINDVIAAARYGQAGLHQQFEIIADRFNRNPDDSLGFLSRTRLAQLIQGAFSPAHQDTTQQTSTSRADTNTLTESVVQIYLSDYRLVRLLAQEYGFEFYLFWQPVISEGEKPLTQDEQLMQEEMANYPGLSELYDNVYTRINRLVPRYDHLYYLAHIFDTQDSQIYIDFMHTSPVGNQLVADEMFRTIRTHPDSEISSW